MLYHRIKSKVMKYLHVWCNHVTCWLFQIWLTNLWYTYFLYEKFFAIHCIVPVPLFLNLLFSYLNETEMSGGKRFKRVVYLRCSCLLLLFYLHYRYINKIFILPIDMSTSTFSLAENFALLWNFLRTSSLDKITTSNIITQLWNCFKI